MKINKISFENFKSYSNKTVFDLSSNNHINIILGENGNGKTSFLEGISLAFFGCKMFGSDVYTNDYILFVTSRLSNQSRENFFEIKVEYFDDGKIYDLRRKFTIVNNEIDEEFELKCEGSFVNSSNFLDKYDYSIMKQLFFDGEVINRIIEESKINTFIQKFINIAFNIKVFNQIEKDLTKLNDRDFKSIQTSEHKVAESNVKKLNDERDYIVEKLKKNKQYITNFSQQLKTIKIKLDKRGVKVGAELQSLLNENEIITNKINDLENNVKSKLNEDIHYLLHKKELDKVVKQLSDTRENRLTSISEFYNKLSDEGVESILPDDYIAPELEKYFVDLNMEANNKDIDSILKNLRKLVRERNKQTKNKNVIVKTNEGRDRLDEVDEYETIFQNVNSLKDECVDLERQLQETEELLDSRQKELDKFTEKLISQRIDKNFASEKDKLKRIVEKYSRIKTIESNDLIAKRSLSILKSSFLRKEKLLDRIDLSDGELSVYYDNKYVDYESFSEGEKQMLVVSILFAIIEIAQINIPLVLDSFVGRLDVFHTDSILSYIKNNIESQVIILATDSEIDENKITYLSDAIGSCFRLSNDGYSTSIDEVIL